MNKIATKPCDYCGGTGQQEMIADDTPLKYGNHTIGKDWAKVDNVWIWFEAFHRGIKWKGLPGYVYERPSGEYLAPFRGKLIPVLKDTRDEFREAPLREVEVPGTEAPNPHTEGGE